MDFLVVGSGLSGSTAARVLGERGHHVIVAEKLPHIGGNAFDYFEEGILVHKYGPHIYHTNSDRVHNFLSQFTQWIPYKHRVLARVLGEEVPLPFNFSSVDRLFSFQEAISIKNALTEEYGKDAKVSVRQLMDSQNLIAKNLGVFVYQNVFFNYTLKQWGASPDKINPEVLRRVPVCVGYEDGYFSDKHQFMPKEGYGVMIQNMLNHKNISVLLDTDANQLLTLQKDRVLLEGKNTTVLYTGCIDQFFDFCFGYLEYRTLRFEFETIDKSSFQGAAVVNYPNEQEFTRISEFSKFTCPPQSRTIVAREYPDCHAPNLTIPYYPIENEQNLAVYNLYKKKAQGINNFYPLGRLGNYKYINMDRAVEDALNLAERLG